LSIAQYTYPTDHAYRYGAQLISRCQAYKNAELEICEAILTIENIWRTMQMQIEILRDHWNDLPGDLQVHENSILSVLQTKIQLAVAKVDGLIRSPGLAVEQQLSGIVSLKSIKEKQGKVRRSKFAAVRKHPLQEIIEEMEKWQAIFDRSWFMITMVQSPSLDKSVARESAKLCPPVIQMRNLRRAAAITQVGDGDATAPSNNQTSPIFIDAAELTPVVDDWIPYSEALIAVRTHRGGHQERVLVDNGPRAMSKRDVRNLARKFADMDPLIVHLLACEGVVEATDDNGQGEGFQFVFKLLQGSNKPYTLRAALMSSSSKYSLSERIEVTISLARSLIFLHESRFVHKSIRPETIILIADNSKKEGLGKPFLIGFDEVRSEDSYTSLHGDNVAERNLYRHPHRQGLVAQERYNVRHDIYSLGVCLLEIGLWTTFVSYSSVGAEQSK
jgi:hypothetical protein